MQDLIGMKFGLKKKKKILKPKQIYTHKKKADDETIIT